MQCFQIYINNYKKYIIYTDLKKNLIKSFYLIKKIKLKTLKSNFFILLKVASQKNLNNKQLNQTLKAIKPILTIKKVISFFRQKMR